MEEKKPKNQEKLSYEELNRAASDLSVQYQKAVQHIRMLESKLEELNFNCTAFLLDALFKVMDHAELYEEKFVTWARDNIQEAIASFYEQSTPQEPQQEAKADAS